MVTPGALDMTVLMKFVPLNWVDNITTRTIAQEQAIAIITHAIPQGVGSHNLARFGAVRAVLVWSDHEGEIRDRYRSGRSLKPCLCGCLHT